MTQRKKERPLSPSAVKQLVEIFMHVADICDGGLEYDPAAQANMRAAYATAMRNPGIRRLYGDLVQANHAFLD